MRSRRLLVRPEAEADIQEAYGWYEAQRKGLGEDFLLCVEEGLARIARNPSVYSIVHKDIRRLLIHRFPFGIFFLEAEDSISVLAVLHARRNPKAWKGRT
ncbi:MAG TPA: type II toxin-antitoxin system RelE/ParE family toxin [Gammaproteobacteria bacterium]|nr:type II toxin-antitoxin system RelE/ParE family toxin [Gammaproteobacteria bacterium]